MRMPISRVRSVTLTSMMFMIPMPPTRSETAATLASSVVIVSRALLLGARRSRSGSGCWKSSSSAAGEVMALAEQRR